MNFTTQQLEQFKEIWKNKEYVTIRGVNQYGDEFETTGRITTTDKDTCALYEDAILLEFGNRKYNESDKRTRFCAPYYVTKPTSKYDSKLIILSIEHNGNIIYENDEKEEILDVTAKIKQDEFVKLQKEGRDVLPQCAVVDALRTMIGKPFILDDECNVLISIRGVNIYGEPILDVARTVLLGNTFVRKDSFLVTENNDGKIKYVAENNMFEFEKQANEISKRIQEHKQNLTY